MKKESYAVPEKMRDQYDAIVALTDKVCLTHLNEEYAELARKMAAALSRKRPSPFTTGRAKSWAAGVVYALGQVNFLFDSSQTPHLKATELCALFGVSQSTASGKAQAISKDLDLVPLHPGWCLPGMMDKNPMAWMIMVNGMVVDARRLPCAIQQEAYEKGLIPYVPDA